MHIRWIIRLLLGGLFIFVSANHELVQTELPAELWLSSWIGVLVAIAAFWIVMELTCRYLVRHSSVHLAGFLAVVVVVFVYFDTFGTLFGWYQEHRRYDQVVHFFGGAVLALWCYSWLPAVAHTFHQSVPPVWIGAAAVGLSTIAGIVFELGEYAIDIMNDKRYWLGDAVDTISDLSLGVLGALVIVGAAVFLRIQLPYSRIQYRREADPQ